MKKIKKQWLVSLLILISIVCLLDVYGIISTSSEEKFNSAVDLICRLIWGWITYHCAYKKQGTKWLIWTLITLSIAIIRDIKETYSTIQMISSQGLSIVNLDLILFCLLIIPATACEIWFWINCVQLRDENLRLKHIQESIKAGAIPKPSQFS